MARSGTVLRVDAEPYADAMRELLALRAGAAALPIHVMREVDAFLAAPFDFVWTGMEGGTFVVRPTPRFECLLAAARAQRIGEPR